MADRQVNRPRSGTERLFACLIYAQKRFCGALIVAMVVIVAAEVLCRGLLGVSLQVTHELAGYLLVAVSFLGMGVSLHDRALFRVEFLYERLPVRGQHAIQLVFDLLALGIGLVLNYQLARLVISSYVRGVREATILATPLFIPQIAMPIGMSLMLLVLLVQIWEDIQALSRPSRRDDQGTLSQ